MTKEEILHLATLSRIKVTDEEVTKFQGEIGAIVDYVASVKEIVGDRGVVKGTGPVYNVFRKDEVTDDSGSTPEDLIKAFPERQGQHLRVQKILNPDSTS